VAAVVLSGVAGLVLAFDAESGTLQISVGPLTIVSSKASGTVSGLPAGMAVTIDGNPYTASESGTVTLTLAQLGVDSALTIQFTDAGGIQRSAAAPLVDTVTGETLTPAELSDPVPNVTRAVDLTVEVADGPTSSTTTSGGSGGGGTTTTTTTTATTTTTPTAGASGGALPAGAIRLQGGLVSIPVLSVRAPHRLVVKRVTFSPRTMRSPRRAVAAVVQVRDSRGYVVRGAIVTLRSVRAASLRPLRPRTTNLRGLTTFRLYGRPAAWRTPGLRLALTVHAARKSDPSVMSRRVVARLRLVRLS
jgi:hypothetical protein